VYIAVLSISGVLGTEEVINVVHGLGTTLLAPIVGLIGAVIGFYYGGQTAVQGTEQARQAATETASHVANQAADKAANQAADKTVRAVTDSTTEATKKVTEAADKATRAAQDVQEAVTNHPEKTNG
jgi:predicted methyltransferase